MSASGVTGRPGVFAVDDTGIQVTWRDLPAGTVEVRAADAVATRDHHGGPGEVRLHGLEPWTATDVRVRVDGRDVGHDRVRTGPPGPGAELARFATKQTGVKVLFPPAGEFGAESFFFVDSAPPLLWPIGCVMSPRNG